MKKRSYTKEEIKTIRKLMRTTKDAVMQRKYMAIRLHMQGYTNKKIAEILGLNEQTVGIYIKNYATLGIEGLIPKKSSGAPSFLTKEQQQQLYLTIKTKTPDEVGVGNFKNWTSSLACQWVLREFEVSYSINGMLDLLHRLGLSYTRPTYVLANADLEKQEQFKEDFEEVKKNSWIVT